jgi:hypothetical protein
MYVYWNNLMGRPLLSPIKLDWIDSYVMLVGPVSRQFACRYIHYLNGGNSAHPLPSEVDILSINDLVGDEEMEDKENETINNEGK